MNIIVTGDSHVAALKFGMDILLNNNAWESNHQIVFKPLGRGGGLKKPFFIDKGSFAEIINPRYSKRIKRLPFAEGKRCYDYYGISGPLFAIHLWRPPQKWSNYTPFISQGDKAPITSGLLRNAVLQYERYTLQLIELLKRESVKVFVIDSPKPFRHHPALNIISPDLLIYLDSFYRMTIRDRLAAINVPVIDMPSACYDADGFMHEKFRHASPSDVHHANDQFGVLIIKEIIKFVEERG